MPKYNRSTFYCFSPPVMVATFFIEIILAWYVLLRYKRGPIVYLSSVILLTLAVFQLAEYGVCEGSANHTLTWAAFGFASITLLPVLGLHLVSLIARIKHPRVLSLAYGTALVWITLFLLGNVIDSTVCTGNYVIFQMNENFGGLFFLYYYFWLFYAISLAWRYASKTDRSNTKQSLIWLIIGYLVFILPATAIWLLDNDAARGLPSIMCGFALLFAFILALKIVPLAVNIPAKKLAGKNQQNLKTGDN